MDRQHWLEYHNSKIFPLDKRAQRAVGIAWITWLLSSYSLTFPISQDYKVLGWFIFSGAVVYLTQCKNDESKNLRELVRLLQERAEP
jgi:hypothetical protein